MASENLRIYQEAVAKFVAGETSETPQLAIDNKSSESPHEVASQIQEATAGQIWDQ